MLMLVVAIAFATAVVSANGHTAHNVVADVPFDFVVGNQTMPAGEYLFSRDSAPDTALLIRNGDARMSAFLITSVIQPRTDETKARLIFHRYGERYFLVEAWSKANEAGRQIAMSRQERAILSELTNISSKSEWALSCYEMIEVVALKR